jgi:hypothetical protein
MKHLPRYLLAAGLVSLLAALLVLNQDLHFVELPGWGGHEGFYAPPDTPDPEISHELPTSSDYEELSQADLGTGTPDAACSRAPECAPLRVKIGGQFCQYGRPYTNVEIESPGEVDIHVSDQADTTSVSYDEASHTLIITVHQHDGTTHTYRVHDYPDAGINISTPVSGRITLPAAAACVPGQYDGASHTTLISCTGPEDSVGYVLLEDPCSCKARGLRYVEIPIASCDRKTESGKSCPPGSTVCYNFGSQRVCYCTQP